MQLHVWFRVHTYILPVCHLQELTAIPSGTQVKSLVFDWISKDLYLMFIHTRKTVGCLLMEHTGRVIIGQCTLVTQVLLK